MKHGEKASGWNVKKLPISSQRIFNQSPSRRADFEPLTQAISSDQPLQFCANHWVENERVAMGARDIWPKIAEIIYSWEGLSKSKKPGKGKTRANTSYEHLCSVQKYPLVLLKFLEENVIFRARKRDCWQRKRLLKMVRWLN